MRFAPYMDVALAEARAAFARAETPVGAAIVDPAANRVIVTAGNRTRELNDPTAHAEILAIRTAQRSSCTASPTTSPRSGAASPSASPPR